MTAMRVPELVPVLVPVDAEVPDEELSLDDLGSRIVGMAGRLAAATCRWLLLVAEFDRREGFARHGLPSTTRWLSFACGLSRRTAHEHMRVARALVAFPALAEAMTSGSLSFSHARAISRLAHGGESSTVESSMVDELIELARNATIAQLEDTVRGLRTVEHAEADDVDSERGGGEPQRPEQYFSHAWTGQSQWRGQLRLDPENGALVQHVVETIARTEKVTVAEALVRMAEIALSSLNDAADDAGPGSRPLRGDERAAVIVHVDAALIPAALIPAEVNDTDVGPTESGPRSIDRGKPVGRIRSGPGLSTAVIMQLMCAGRIRTVVHDAQGSPLDLGRSHRVVSKKLFSALLLRDGGCCTHPGCGSRAGLEAHHVRHWLHGGRTDLANLVLLCLRHHHAHHDGEFSITVRPGPRGSASGFVFCRSDGRELAAHIDPAALSDADTPIEQEYASVPHDAARGRWCGDHLDLDYAVAVLVAHRKHTAGSTHAPGPPIHPRVDPWAMHPDPWARTA